MNSPTDNALMLRVKEGETSSMSLLFKRYHKELFGFFYHMCNNSEVCEDMVQTAFYRMIKYGYTFSGRGCFRGWMYQLARNVFIDNVKQNSWYRKQCDINEFIERIDDGMAADESLSKEEQIKELQTALEQLSISHREVLVMREYQELKCKQIAQILNLSENAVKVRIHRALFQLKTIYLNPRRQ